MKATGVVRRIDDLGRVVIPKEIRRTMRIREGDSLEIFVNQSGEVVLKNTLQLLIFQLLHNNMQMLCKHQLKRYFNCRSWRYYCGCRGHQKQYLNRRVSRPLSDMIENRTSKIAEGKEVLEIVDGETTERSFVMIPIISNGDSLGAVILVGTEEDELVNELDINSVKIATAFLGKYLEG